MFRPTLGGCLVVVALFFGVFLYLTLQGLYLLWDGVTTQGVIVFEKICEPHVRGCDNTVTVEFTDQTGQVNLSTFDLVFYPTFDASSGDSVTMVYAPVDPAINAPLYALMDNLHFYLFADWFFGLISLILFWRSKRKQNTY